MNKFKLATIFLGSIISVSMIIPVGSLALAPEIRKEIREEVKENSVTRPGLMQKVANKRTRAAILNATILSKNGTTLTVTKDGKTYTVGTDAKTQLRRRFWGKSTLDEMQMGDSVNVHGKWTDDSQTTVQAVLIRDLSIQKRFGTFFGTVNSVTGGSFVIETVEKGNQLVTVVPATKIVNRKGETISQSDVSAGHRIRVKGLWDSKTNTITEVTHVKDFNLPAKPTPTK